MGTALVAAGLLALVAASATQQRLREEGQREAADRALAARLAGSVSRGLRLDEAAELLARCPAHHHPRLRAELPRARARQAWQGAWTSPAALRAALAGYEAVLSTDLTFLSERSALRFALGVPDPERPALVAQAGVPQVPAKQWLDHPAGRLTAIDSWTLLRAGKGDAAYRRFARAPTRMRIDLALTGFELATTPQERQAWINRALKHLMNASSFGGASPSQTWRFNRARARHEGRPPGPLPQTHDALGALLRAEDLLASDPLAAAAHAATVRGLPPGGVPLAPLRGKGGPQLVALPLAARVLEARAWDAAGNAKRAAAARQRAQAWAALDRRPLHEWVPELR